MVFIRFLRMKTSEEHGLSFPGRITYDVPDHSSRRSAHPPDYTKSRSSPSPAAASSDPLCDPRSTGPVLFLCAVLAGTTASRSLLDETVQPPTEPDMPKKCMQEETVEHVAMRRKRQNTHLWEAWYEYYPLRAHSSGGDKNWKSTMRRCVAFKVTDDVVLDESASCFQSSRGLSYPIDHCCVPENYGKQFPRLPQGWQSQHDDL